MEGTLVPLLKSLLLVPATLLPVINPLGIAPIFAAGVGPNRKLASHLARQVAINSWVIIMVSILTGSYVLAMFGISLPVVRLGGGLLVAATAWRMLQSNAEDEVQAAAVGTTIVALALYVIFANSARVLAWLGEVGVLVLTRLMAFLLLCVGIQIMWTGWAELNAH